VQAAQAAAPSRAGPTPRATRGSLGVALLDKEQQSDAGGVEIDGALWQQSLPHLIIYAGKALIRCNQKLNTKYYEKGAVRPGTFDSIVPFYKDEAFRQVSMQCIVQGMGAIVGKSPAQCIDQSVEASITTDAQ
jgi:hypothetical protein